VQCAVVVVSARPAVACRALYFVVVSILDGPVLLDEHFACAGAFSRDLARKTRLHDLSHDARAQLTSLTQLLLE